MAAGTVSRNVQIIVSMSNRLAGPAGYISSSLWNMVKAARAAQFVFQGFSKVVGYFISINKELEDLTLSFAGIMRAKGLANSFGDAMLLSRDFIQEIRNQAGLLPGSLNQYVEIARQSYQELGNLGFKTVKEQAQFIGQYGAVALTLQVPAAQAGRDLMHMLSGNVRANTRMWALLRHEIGLNGKEWKALTDQQRATKIQSALGKYNEMVKAAANTWDAASGAFGTHMQDIARIASAPYFEALKKFLQGLNEVLADNKQQIAQLLRMVVQLTAALAVLKVVSHQLDKRTGANLATWLGGRVSLRNPFAGAFAAGTKSVTTSRQVSMFPLGLQGALVRAGQRGAGGGPGMLSATLSSTRLVSLTAMERFTRGMLLIVRVIGSLGRLGVVAFVIWGLVGAFMALAKNTGGVHTALMQALDGIQRHLQPALVMFGQIAGYLNPDGDIGLFFASIITGFFSNLHSTFQVIAATSRYIAAVWGMITGSFTKQDAARTMGVASWTLDPQHMGFGQFHAGLFGALLQQVQNEDDEAAKLAAQKRLATLQAQTPGARNGPPIYNFQNSKFVITQQFAEGFDPDRVAVAFADDLAALADRRLQSSFAPVGAI